MGLGPSYPPGAIVVPASIAGTPFVEGHLVYISGGKLVSVANGLVDSPGTASESVVLGGSGTDSVQLGRLAVASGNRGIAIGLGALATAVDTLAIGSGALATNPNAVVIGGGATGQVGNVVVVGQSASANASGNIAIGQNAQATRATMIAIGINAGVSVLSGSQMIVVGSGAFLGAGWANCIWLGHGTSATLAGATDTLIIGHGFNVGPVANTGYIGSPQTVLNTIYLGRGPTHTAAHNFVLRGTAVTGGNVAGGSFTIRTGDGSGVGVPGAFRVQQRNAGGGTDTPLEITDIDIILDARAGDLVFKNFTDGAGALGGTLTNAPSAGNPANWLRVKIGANVRYIPAWA